MTTEPTRRVVGTEVRDSHVLLTVEHLSKKFCRSLKRSLFYGVQDIATELVGGRRKDASLRPREFWALRDVSCQLRRGEALGLVGSNGAGKSTLLRIISGLIKPDTGSATVRGKVAPLIALGQGKSTIASTPCWTSPKSRATRSARPCGLTAPAWPRGSDSRVRFTPTRTSS